MKSSQSVTEIFTFNIQYFVDTLLEHIITVTIING